MKKTKLWCFTNYDLSFNYEYYYHHTTAEYVAYSLEICPTTGRPHHQGFVWFSAERSSIKEVAEQLGKCNVRMCGGNLDQNADYCSKFSSLIKWGNPPRQGKRTDLITVRDEIINGKSVDELALENPILFHQYGRTLNKLEDIILRRKWRTEMTEGIWYWGKTGAGKSHKAFEGFNNTECYTYPNDNGWWDGYAGQPIVIINEFRGGIPYAELLDLCDKWPKTVRRRNREPVPFLATKLIITSSMKPSDVYYNIDCIDSLDQLKRRFKIIEISNGDEVIGGNTEPQS